MISFVDSALLLVVQQGRSYNRQHQRHHHRLYSEEEGSHSEAARNVARDKGVSGRNSQTQSIENDGQNNECMPVWAFHNMHAPADDWIRTWVA